MLKSYKFPWEKLLAKYFRTVKAIDSEIEDLRQELCSKASFIPKELFHMIDNKNKSFLSLNDFKLFLNGKYIHFTEEVLRRFIHNFDKDGDFSIDYNEFMNIILPRENDELKTMTIKRRSNGNINGNRENEMDYSIELVFIKIIQMELNLISELASIAEEMKISKDFTTYEAFLVIVNDDKYITETNFERFLLDNSVELKGNELLTLLFRIDSDADGKVSYEEFIEIFFPLQPALSNGSKESNHNNNSNNSDKGNDMHLEQGKTTKEKLTYSITRDSNLGSKHGISRYDNKTDYIMLGSTKAITNKDKDKDMDHKSQRDNHCRQYRRHSSQQLKEDNCKYNFNYFSKNIIEDDIHTRNSQLKDKENDKSLNNNCITPQRQEQGQRPRHEERDSQLKQEYKYEKKELHQTYQINYNDSTPLPIEKHSSQKNKKANTLTFNRNKARYHIRTIPKVIQMTKQKGRNNGSNHNDNGDNGQNHTCCGMILGCGSCHCCSCLPFCKIKKGKDYLFTFLNDLVMNDAKIEEIKDEIASDNEITMLGLFDYFDEKRRNYISKKDLQDKLNSIGLIVSLTDINVIYNQYDRDEDGLLNFEEFSDLLLPKKYEEAKVLNERKQLASLSSPVFTFNYFNSNTMRLLSELFSLIINSEKANEKNKNNLFAICSIDDSFNLLKNRYSSVIYQEDITEFLKEKGLSLHQYELDLLIERFDKNQDGIISLDEYTNAISPISTS